MLGLSEFRLLPAGSPPHRSSTYASGLHRLAMLRLAVADHPDLLVDDREVRRLGASYMVDTLQDIREVEDDKPLMLMVGQDAANQLDSWHQWRQLFELAHLVIMTRPNSRHDYADELAVCIDSRSVSENAPLFGQPAGLVRYLEVTQLAISSTDIRRQIRHGGSPRFLLPDRILGYIEYHQLYH